MNRHLRTCEASVGDVEHETGLCLLLFLAGGCGAGGSALLTAISVLQLGRLLRFYGFLLVLGLCCRGEEKAERQEEKEEEERESILRYQ